MRSATTNALRFRREITARMTSRVIISRPVGLALVVAAVLARSAMPLYWGDVHFNADHATTGLMAKHIAEGRAFPVMQYGAQYVLVLEAWLTAPLTLVADNSPSLLAVVPVVFNAPDRHTAVCVADRRRVADTASRLRCSRRCPLRCRA